MKPQTKTAGLATLAALAVSGAHASELSYTFMDFQYVDQSTSAMGAQEPVTNQLVEITTGNGDGVAVGGALAIRDMFYLGGSFTSSIIDVSGVVTNPLGETEVTDTFDLIHSRLAFGYYKELSPNFDATFELSYDTADYDFGSFAGEGFDLQDSGVGAAIGFRWNPTPSFELFASGRYTPVGKALLTENDFDADTTFNTGFRWYFFEDLGLGVNYEDGEVETVTFTLRFGFGNLPW